MTGNEIYNVMDVAIRLNRKMGERIDNEDYLNYSISENEAKDIRYLCDKIITLFETMEFKPT